MTTFDDWAQSDDMPEPDDNLPLLVWLAEIADALVEFGHPGED